MKYFITTPPEEKEFKQYIRQELHYEVEDNFFCKLICPYGLHYPNIIDETRDANEFTWSICLKCTQHATPYYLYICRYCNNTIFEQPKQRNRSDKEKALFEAMKLHNQEINHDELNFLTQQNLSILGLNDMEEDDGAEFGMEDDNNNEICLNHSQTVPASQINSMQSTSKNFNFILQEVNGTFNIISGYEKALSALQKIIVYFHYEESYASYIIEKKWRKTAIIEKSKLNPRQVLVFIKVLRYIVKNSRDEALSFVEMIADIQYEQNIKNHHYINRLKEKDKEIDALRRKLMSIPCGIPLEISPMEISIEKDNLGEDIIFPRNLRDIQSLLRNKSSILNDLPIPPLIDVDKECIVLPSMIVPTVIAIGADIELITKDYNHNLLHPRSPYKSPFVIDMISNYTTEGNNTMNDELYFVGIGFWSDGADISGSKQQRSRIRVYTVHILSYPNHKRNVFPVCISRKQANDKQIFDILMNDLKTLTHTQRKCFVPKLNRSVWIKFFLAYTIQDRPEHADFTGFLGHAGTFSSVVGYSCPIVTNHKFVLNR